MHSELIIQLKKPVQYRDVIAEPIRSFLGRKPIDLDIALQNTPYTDFQDRVFAAAVYPNGDKVFYLHLESDKVVIVVLGKTIESFKKHCNLALERLKSIKKIKITDASAAIMTLHNGTYVEVITGIKASKWNIFFETLLANFYTKLISAFINCIMIFLIFSSKANTQTPVISAAVGLLATFVSVFSEAIHAAYKAESWAWKGSK